jgi:hypothetical protein
MTEMQMPDGRFLLIPDAWTCFIYRGVIYKRCGQEFTPMKAAA